MLDTDAPAPMAPEQQAPKPADDKQVRFRGVIAAREAEAREQARHEEEIAEAIKHRDAQRLKAELAKKKGGTPLALGNASGKGTKK